MFVFSSALYFPTNIYDLGIGNEYSQPIKFLKAIWVPWDSDLPYFLFLVKKNQEKSVRVLHGKYLM